MPVIAGGQEIPGNGLSVNVFKNPGAPAANLNAGNCVVGSLLIDTTAGKLYICTATNGTSTATWTVVGTQV